MVDLADVRWIGTTRIGVAEALGARLGIAVKRVADESYQSFRRLLAELQELDAERVIVAGPLAPPAVAAVLRDAGHAVFLADEATARDARVLRLRTLPPDASAEAVAAELGLSAGAGTSP